MVENEYSKVKVNNELFCYRYGCEGSSGEGVYEGKGFLFFEMGETRLLCKAFLRF